MYDPARHTGNIILVQVTLVKGVHVCVRAGLFMVLLERLCGVKETKADA